MKKFKPYKASRSKGFPQNRGTGRLKTFRDVANRSFRIASRRQLQKCLQSNGEIDFECGPVAAGYWD